MIANNPDVSSGITLPAPRLSGLAATGADLSHLIVLTPIGLTFTLTSFFDTVSFVIRRAGGTAHAKPNLHHLRAG
jgi:hypothetical protein